MKENFTSNWLVEFMVISPPGANKVRFVKFSVFMLINDSIRLIPVSLAPTTTILLFTFCFGIVRCFLLIMLRAKGLSS